MNAYLEQQEESRRQLLENLKRDRPDLEALHERVHDPLVLEDIIYRHYDHSEKTWNAQHVTKYIVDALERLAPEGRTFCTSFRAIIDDGMKERFDYAFNKDWDTHARPVIEAFFHATYFLDMAVKYAREEPYSDMTIGEHTGTAIARGYAALLELYGIR